MGYMLKLLPKEMSAIRGKGPARFIIKVNGEIQKKYGILFIDTAKSICAAMPSYRQVEIQELTEREIMDFLLNGWRQGG